MRKMNEYPNPPWNTVEYDPEAVYPENSKEWYAQQLAKHAQRIGLTYSLIDKSEVERQNLQNYLQRQKEAQRKQEMDKEEPQKGPHHKSEGIAIKNGVLTDTHLYRFNRLTQKLQKVELAYPITNVKSLLQLCLDYNLASLWVLTGTEISKRANRAFIESTGDVWHIKSAQYTYSKEGPLCKALSAYKEKAHRLKSETWKDVYINFAERNTDWYLNEETNPLVVLATITYLEDVLDLPVNFGAATVGKRVMQRENDEGKRKEWVTPVKLHEIPPFVLTKVQPIVWNRPLTEEEKGKEFLIALDRNMQHTYSCTNLLLGAGMPEHVVSPVFHTDSKNFLPGLWNIDIEGTSIFDGKMLPHFTDGITSGWFYSYKVRSLIELGYHLTIKEAYVWKHENAHTILKPYALSLWEARKALDDKLQPNTKRYNNPIARKIASKGVKLVANAGMGLLDHPPQDTSRGDAYDWYRPDWFNLLKDRAYDTLLWKVRELVRAGFYPIAIDTDCLYFASDEPNHAKAIPGMLDHSKELGGYKPKYKRTITIEEVAPLFESMSISEINTILLERDK